MAAHALLNTFKAGKIALGAWLTVPGYFHARMVARASPNLSWIIIDCEHGFVPLVPGAAESVAAIHGAVPNASHLSPSALIRIPATGISASTSWQIKYALDAGARGVLVPMVKLLPFNTLMRLHQRLKNWLYIYSYAVGFNDRESQRGRRRLSFPSRRSPRFRKPVCSRKLGCGRVRISANGK